MKGRLKQPFFMNILGVLRQEGRRICRGVNAVSGGRFRRERRLWVKSGPRVRGDSLTPAALPSPSSRPSRFDQEECLRHEHA